MLSLSQLKTNSCRVNCDSKAENVDEKVNSNLKLKNRLRSMSTSRGACKANSPHQRKYWMKGVQIITVTYSQIRSLYKSKILNRGKWGCRNAVTLSLNQLLPSKKKLMDLQKVEWLPYWRDPKGILLSLRHSITASRVVVIFAQI